MSFIKLKLRRSSVDQNKSSIINNNINGLSFVRVTWVIMDLYFKQVVQIPVFTILLLHLNKI